MSPAAKTAVRPAKRAPKRAIVHRALLVLAALLASFYVASALSLALLRWIDPPTTSVHIQRRVESWFHKGPYHKRYTFVPLTRISPHFQHAVISAEDARFYTHHGFDWKEVQNAVEDELEDKRSRGASTITQQLVKNLFLTTWHSPIRKALETPLVPAAEVLLGKQRILELYMNVVEWGPGIYGAEAVAQADYHVSAARISRVQGARLAAVLPSPRRRKPAKMNYYTAKILTRMSQVGW